MVGGAGGGDVGTTRYAVRRRFLLVEVTATTIQAQILSGIATGRTRNTTVRIIPVTTTVCENK